MPDAIPVVPNPALLTVPGFWPLATMLEEGAELFAKGAFVALGRWLLDRAAR